MEDSMNNCSLKIVLASLSLAIVVLIGCEEATNLPDTGSEETVSAPPTIIGRVVVMTVTERFTECTALVGTVGRIWFVDEDTIRAVRDDGTFDQPTTSWEYSRTSSTAGRIEMDWANGSWSIFQLVFTSETGGTYEVTEGPPTSRCNPQTHAKGTFEIQVPPDEA